jgi:hypothetical protein
MPTLFCFLLIFIGKGKEPSTTIIVALKGRKRHERNVTYTPRIMKGPPCNGRLPYFRRPSKEVLHRNVVFSAPEMANNFKNNRRYEFF